MTLSFKGYLLLNGSLLFFISFNNVFNFNLINLTLILSILLYSIKWNEGEWLVPLLLFAWGIFQDILLGMNLGYSGSIFLYFYVLSQFISINGLFEQQKMVLFGGLDLQGGSSAATYTATSPSLAGRRG